jgi:CHASE2 domain-containing sensor protein
MVGVTPAEHLSVPVYPFAVWIMAALDPVLIAVSVYLGWKADQFGKLFIAAIAGLAVAVLFSWAVTAIGIPWPAPISHDGPTFFPVRIVGAFVWALVGYGSKRATQTKS